MNITAQFIDTTTLANGVEIPMMGLGVLKAKDGNEVAQAVTAALHQGYRLIDTAAIYKNESGVGLAIKESGIPREEIFLTTKVWNSDQGYNATMKAFEQSLEKLQTEYVDLYLIHWPVAGKFKDTWRALEALYRQGKVRAIGVSNFQVRHLKELMETAQIAPMVNQVEMHPHLQQEELVKYSKEHNIQLQAWRPVMMGEVTIIPELRELARKHNKSPFQIALRWLVQKGVVAIPKSVNTKRIAQNADIFDFELSSKDMATIAHLNLNRRLGPDPDNFNF